MGCCIAIAVAQNCILQERGAGSTLQQISGALPITNRRYSRLKIIENLRYFVTGNTWSRGNSASLSWEWLDLHGHQSQFGRSQLPEGRFA